MALKKSGSQAKSSDPSPDPEVAYSGPLHRYLARQLRDRQDASDLAQEAYLRFLQLPDAGAIRDASGYIFRIALNLLSEWRWRRDRALVAFDSKLADAQVEARPAVTPDELELLMRREQLAAVLDQIPHTYRQVLLWNKCDGLSNDQIAAKLGVTSQTVVRYLAKATSFARKARWDESDTGSKA
jgi:RNA polymerase sigma factor (sigma-70 family)